jgi:hypothetical protein
MFEREQRKKAFLTLQQGASSVFEYIYQFHRLERYYAGLYGTPKCKASKFVDGLRDGLRRDVISSRPQNLSQAVECARELEETISVHVDLSLRRKETHHLGMDKGRRS